VQSIRWLESQMGVLATLPTELEHLRCQRLGIVEALYLQIERYIDEYRSLYQPVQEFVEATASMEMPLPLAFSVRVTEEGFQEVFLAKVNRQTRGTFAGIDESAQLTRGVLKAADFSSAAGAIDFVTSIDDMLHFDRRQGSDGSAVSLGNQLRKGVKAEEVYDFVFGLAYLRPRYSLTYGGQEINRLSPGERGLLLLVFYLLVDKDDVPLVIDQPEENLDNQTIYRVLVTCIKAAKERRQVVMVTHNPNLAVVCDAEQIVCASCDKDRNVFSYVSGAIEASEINNRIVEVLEGTAPAFLNRKQKYGL
jgi:hypothetical protein